VDDQPFCGACGAPAAMAGHDGCPARLRLDPPRFCMRCGARLDVQVFPTRVASRCRRRTKAVQNIP
jgi:hypothetical protein